MYKTQKYTLKNKNHCKRMHSSLSSKSKIDQIKKIYYFWSLNVVNRRPGWQDDCEKITDYGDAN